MTSYKLVMPEDMNHYGFLFGGKLLMWVDELAWIAVSNDYPGYQFVTIGMNQVEFKKSVHLRSVLRFDIQRQREGNTSVTYHVDVFSHEITQTFVPEIVNIFTISATVPIPSAQMFSKRLTYGAT